MKSGERVETTYYRCSKPIRECSLPKLTENDLFLACREMLGNDADPEIVFARDVKRLLVFEDRLEFEKKDGEVKIWQRRK